MRQIVRDEFDKGKRDVSLKDFERIEHMLRVGRRQLERLQSPTVQRLSVSKPVRPT